MRRGSASGRPPARRSLGWLLIAGPLLAAGCGAGDAGGWGTDAGADGARPDLLAIADGPAGDLAEPDATPPRDPLDLLRDGLIATLLQQGESSCSAWDGLERSQRAVFLTLTDRLYRSATPDGLSMLHHLDRLYLVLGGGSDGTKCTGADNNRLFLSMDRYLWDRMVETRGGLRTVGDGGGSTWKRSGDPAGPHAPFSASDETDSGLRCLLLIETPDSHPPTAQGHFFLAGSEVPVVRGSRVDLPTDPYMLEIDHDFDCIHRSNPICPGTDFEKRYTDHYGDFRCAYVPAGCAPRAAGCYPGAL